MRRLLPALIALIAAAPAWAGPHLRWNAPYGHPDAAVDRTFACDTNTGFDRLVVSFWPPDSVERVTALTTVIDARFSTGSAPAWWHPVDGCRASNGLLPLTTMEPGWDLRAAPEPHFGGRFSPTFDPYQLRMIVSYILDPSGPSFDIGPLGGEVFVLQIKVRRGRTTGTGACEGCLIPACFGVSRIALEHTRADGQSEQIAYSGSSSADQQFYVTWQGGGPFPCPAAVPVTPNSWGQIKASYR